MAKERGSRRRPLWLAGGGLLLGGLSAWLLLLPAGRPWTEPGLSFLAGSPGGEAAPGVLGEEAEPAPAAGGLGFLPAASAPVRRAADSADAGLAAQGLIFAGDGRLLEGARARAFFPDRSVAEDATGPEGEYRLVGAPCSALRLEASAPGHVAQRLGLHPYGARQDFLLQREAVLSVRLVSWRNPKAGLAEGRLVVGDAQRLLDGAVKPAATDAEGWATVAGLVPGAYDLGLIAPGHAPRIEAGVRLQAGENRLTVALQPGFTLRLRVLSARGRLPVEGVEVRAAGQVAPGFRGGAFGPPPRRLATDAQGYCLLTGLPVGVTRVSLRKAGFAEAGFALPVAVTSGEEDREQVIVPGATLAGRVLDPDGRPAPAARVSRVERAGEDQVRPVGRPVQADPQGAFVLQDLPPGKDVILLGQKPGFAPAILLLPRLGPGEERKGLELRLPAGIAVQGKVVDEEGLAVAGARVELLPRGGRNLPFPGVTGPDGVFRVEHLLPWVYDAQVTAVGFLPAEKMVAVPNKPVPAVEAGTIPLHRVFAVEGVVSCPGGLAPRGCAVDAERLPTAAEEMARRREREDALERARAAAARPRGGGQGQGRAADRGQPRPIQAQPRQDPAWTQVGGPAGGAQMRRGGDPRAAGRHRALVDPFGAFRLELPKGRWRLAARGPGLTMDGVEPVVVEVPGDTFVRIYPQIHGSWLAGGLDVRLLDGRTSRPLVSAQVQGLGGARAYMEDGWLRIRQLASGTRSLLVQSPGLMPCLLRDLEIPPGDVLLLGTMLLEPAARLVVAVRGEGKPLPKGVQVRLRDQDGRLPARLLQPTPGPGDGVFRFEGLGTGRYLVQAMAEGYRPGQQEVLIQGGVDNRIHLNLQPRQPPQPKGKPGKPAQKPGGKPGGGPGAKPPGKPGQVQPAPKPGQKPAGPPKK